MSRIGEFNRHSAGLQARLKIKFKPQSKHYVSKTGRLTLFRENRSVFIVRTIRNTQIYEYTNSVRNPQKTHYVSATKPNQLMLFRETVAVYCENHMEHTDI
jgi:hypothetical protein